MPPSVLTVQPTPGTLANTLPMAAVSWDTLSLPVAYADRYTDVHEK